MRTSVPGVIVLLLTMATAVSALDVTSGIPLAQLVANRFGKLSVAEEKLVGAVANGETADCSKLIGGDHIIRGDLLSWLCTDPNASAKLTYRGVSIVGADIVNQVDLSWAQISFPILTVQCVFSDAVILWHSHIAFLRLGYSSVKGGVDLLGAKIDGDLDCDGGQFIGNGKTPALNANGAEVKGHLYLRSGFKAEGEVNLVAARIDGNLECDGGQFISKGKGLALDAGGIEVKGNVFFRDGFKAEGGANLASAKIDGNLECDGGQFVGNDKVPALNADGAKIEGYVFLRNGVKAEGSVIFFSSYVGRSFQWFRVESPEKAILDLRLLKVGTLLNRQDSWPTQGNLRVDGSIYDQIDDTAPPSAEVQLAWLARQPRDRFLAQPFEQLAGVLRKMGLEEDARAVMIAKNHEHARYVQWHPEWLWYGLFGQLIGYGYSPWRAFVISLIVIGIGWWLFRRGYRRGLVTPTGDAEYAVEKDGVHPSSDDYPKFNAFVYSLETFVPLVKLGIDAHWTPNGSRTAPVSEGTLRLPPTTGGWLRGYLWFHIIAGWVLTTLWVGGITGLVKT